MKMRKFLSAVVMCTVIITGISSVYAAQVSTDYYNIIIPDTFTADEVTPADEETGLLEERSWFDNENYNMVDVSVDKLEDDDFEDMNDIYNQKNLDDLYSSFYNGLSEDSQASIVEANNKIGTFGKGNYKAFILDINMGDSTAKSIFIATKTQMYSIFIAGDTSYFSSDELANIENSFEIVNYEAPGDDAGSSDSTNVFAPIVLVVIVVGIVYYIKKKKA